jgi:hypothetical protein
MEAPGGIIPDELMEFDRRRDAFQYVLALPISGQEKVNLWVFWGHWCACKISRREREKLEASGA